MANDGIRFGADEQQKWVGMGGSWFPCRERFDYCVSRR